MKLNKDATVLCEYYVHNKILRGEWVDLIYRKNILYKLSVSRDHDVRLSFFRIFNNVTTRKPILRKCGYLLLNLIIKVFTYTDRYDTHPIRKFIKSILSIFSHKINTRPTMFDC